MINWEDKFSARIALVSLLIGHDRINAICDSFDAWSKNYSIKYAFAKACQEALFPSETDIEETKPTITDRQAAIIGREIGKTIISEACFLRDLARTIGENIRIKV